jgi:hypothetical protein
MPELRNQKEFNATAKFTGPARGNKGDEETK